MEQAEKYHKIQTLFEFDNDNRKFKYGVFSSKPVELLKDIKWRFTEKVDGTNFRLIWDGYDMSYKGRKDKSQFSKIAKEWIEANIATPEMEHMLEKTFLERYVTIFGELYGHDIQKVAKLYSEDYSFKVFDIKVPIMGRPVARKYLDRETVEDISKSLGLDTVPVIFEGTIEEAIEYVKNNPKSTFSEAPLEGLVGVPIGDFLDPNGERIIVKIKSRDLGE